MIQPHAISESFCHILKHGLAFLGLVMTTGCLSSGISRVEKADGFDWHHIKRDQIVMTPLLDLRKNDKAGAFYTDKEAQDYAEHFKQAFFHRRTDIRVFGAGGAFEYLSGLQDLDKHAQQALQKKPLSTAAVQEITKGIQRIRFVWFFAITHEELKPSVHYYFETKKRHDSLTYRSTRELDLKLILWDSKLNKTVWIGSQLLRPSNSKRISVYNPTKRQRWRFTGKKKKRKEIYYTGQRMKFSLSSELKKNAELFPDYPKRPGLQKSFEGVVLNLPMNPEEERLLEYTTFSFHRFGMGLRLSTIGSQVASHWNFRYNTVIYDHWRFGLFFAVPLNSADAKDSDGNDVTIAAGSFGLTSAYEWDFSQESVFGLALALGGSSFSIAAPQDDSAGDVPGIDPDDSENNSEDDTITERTDGVSWIEPTLYYARGKRQGGMFGADISWRKHYGIEEEELERLPPSSLSLTLWAAYNFRTF